VVHNGIIENYLELRRELEAKGHVFQSETDSEVFAHLIAERSRAGPCVASDAVRAAVAQVKGTYALVASPPATPTPSCVRVRLSRWCWGCRRGRTSWPQTCPRCSSTPATSSSWRTATWRWSPVVASPSSTAPARGSSGRCGASTGRRAWPRRAATSTSCTRRSSSSRARWPIPCAGECCAPRATCTSTAGPRLRRRCSRWSGCGFSPAAPRTTRGWWASG
jgi:hypothetical protein